MHLVTSKSAGAEWSKWIAEFKGNIYHSIEWAETQCSNHSYPIFFNYLDNNDLCVGIAVGVKRWSPFRYFGQVSKKLDFESYPAVKGDNIDLARSMMKQLAKFAKGGGYRSLTINSYYANMMVPDMDQLGFTTTPRLEFILDLTLSEDELWRRLSVHHRRKIKKANKHGLQFKETNAVDAMQQLRELQIISLSRRMQSGERLERLEEVFYEEMGKSYFNKNLGRLFLMTQEDQVVSAAFVSIYGGRALYVLGGSNDAGFKLDAPALLFWEIFSRCRELGCREFNMGGVPDSAANPESQFFGLYRFKAGFGGKQVMCLSGSAENLRPNLERLMRIAKKVLQV